MTIEPHPTARSARLWLTDLRRWRALTAAALLLGLAWIALTRAPAEATTGGAPPPSPRENFTAPDFTLELRGGDAVTLSALRGAVVVLNLWASWCPPCRSEMPAMQTVYDAYRERGLVVLAVNTLFQDGEAAANAFADELGLTFPIAFDRTGEMSDRYRLRAMPTTFFIDRRGVIRGVVLGGPMSEALIRSWADQLLAEAP